MRDLPAVEEAARRYPHGTRARYVFARCRCFACRVANTNYVTAQAERRRLPWRCHYAPPSRRYVVRNRDTAEIALRTSDRSEARRLRDELNAEEHADVRDRLTSTLMVRRHVRWLAEQGVGLRTVAGRSGVARSVLRRMVTGEIRRTRRATEARILAVSPLDAGGGAIVDATRTWGFIGCLLSAGWPKARVSRALGHRSPSLQLRSDRVLARSARAVEDVHERAWVHDARVRAVCSHTEELMA